MELDDHVAGNIEFGTVVTIETLARLGVAHCPARRCQSNLT